MNTWPYLFSHSPIADVGLFHPELPSPNITRAQVTMPIGKVMEHAFAAALAENRRYELLIHGLQVLRDRQTLGEIDFIVRDLLTGETWHVEFAYKFYLYQADLGTGPLAPWIGPGGRDRLVYKLDKMQTRQFPLLHLPETAALLAEHDVEVQSLRQGVTFCAHLFLPPDAGVSAIELPLRSGNFAGRWFQRAQAPSPPSPVLDKADWIVSAPQVMRGRAADEYQQILARKGYALCLDASGVRYFVIDR